MVRSTRLKVLPEPGPAMTSKWPFRLTDDGALRVVDLGKGSEDAGGDAHMKPFPSETKHGVRRNNEVVEEFKLDRVRGQDEGAGENLVLLGRADVAVGVVVGADDDRGAAAQGGLDDAARINGGSVHGAFLQGLNAVTVEFACGV